MVKWFIAWLIFLGALGESPAFADHNLNGVLPGQPVPMIRNIWADGEVAWCVDARAAAYPNFVNDVNRTADAAYLVTGIRHRQVAFGTPSTTGCEEQLTMPDETFTPGVAGQIWYYNWPVVVKFNWRLGYANWDTTLGHEGINCGHNTGEHEGYDDINFRSHYNTYGSWASPWNAPTVMDFGTGIWQCTEADKRVLQQVVLPYRIHQYGLRYHPDGTPYVFFGGENLAPATRVALMAIDPAGNWYWTGLHLRPSTGAGDYVGQIIVPGPGWCFALSPEIGGWRETWERPDLRRDQIVGCT